MARPFLADPDFVIKSKENRADEINTCIGCNQACLDHTFEMKIASCLVNPRACHETEINIIPAPSKKKIGIVGAGPAGLAASITAAQRGHEVHLYDTASQIGGQFNMAKLIPGKEEFYETIRYFEKQIILQKVNLFLNTKVDVPFLIHQKFDEIILATGIAPRTPGIEGINHPKVVSYIDVLKNNIEVGSKVAIIGAGGIGFDVAEYLSHQGTSPSLHIKDFMKEWGVDMEYSKGGALTKADNAPSPRTIFLLQRTKGKVGARLGKTTGWIHRAGLKKKNVTTLDGVAYQKIDDSGLHITVNNQDQVLDVDHIVICAGQDPNRSLYQPLIEAKQTVHLIGGAHVAAELDAKRAIDEATRLMITI
ncbi:MAG TPA: FAD-dependent oxidoreductase, partial [Saprospiraceae bacterium]|nr:FAD-dependent oxidoreductase [Saprospiraceae bacterium]